jgi:3-oxoacyl-[acyl-carrier protein] reductase
MTDQVKVALVTGGGTGIGAAVSRELHHRGYHVAVTYSRSAADAEQLVRQLQEQGGQALAVRADVTDDNDVRAATGTVRRELGPISVLVNNAGTTRAFPLDDLEAATDAVFDELFAVNVKGVMHHVRAAAEDLRASGHGAVVNIGSIAGLTGNGSSLPYVTSKAALIGLTKSLARALAPDITVNCVAPGVVYTRWWQGLEEQADRLSASTLLGRRTQPEDIAGLVAGLINARSMTGQVVTIDGGASL